MPRIVAFLALALLVLRPTMPTLAAAPGTNEYNQGIAAYHAQQYAPAVVDFEAAISRGYHAPAAYYLLGLCFSKLQQWNDAVWAYDTTVSLDPSFLDAHPYMSKRLAEAKQHRGADSGPPDGLIPATGTGATDTSPGASSGAPTGPSAPSSQTVVTALASGSVYIDPAFPGNLNGVEEILTTTASTIQQVSSTTARFALISSPPRPFTDLGQYVYHLFGLLKLHRSVLVVISPQGIAARSDRLTQQQMLPLVDYYRPQFRAGTYALGATALANAIVSQADQQGGGSQRWRLAILGGILLAFAAVGAAFGFLRYRVGRRAYSETTSWRDTRAPQLSQTDSLVDGIPPDHTVDTPTTAACFFCAKPLDPAVAQVVSVPIGDATRRVLACDEHAADVQAGRQPQVRTAPDPLQGGKRAPWWTVSAYDPVRDYVYDPYYFRGSGLGWRDLYLYSAIFNHPNSTSFFVGDSDEYDAPVAMPDAPGNDNDWPDSVSIAAAGRDTLSAVEASFGNSGARERA